MKSADFIIIGGSAAGTTAAEVIRQLAPESTITIVTDENHEEYSRVLLPHYIRGKVAREQVFLKKQEWYQDQNISLVKGTKAAKLIPQEHQVELSNGDLYKYGKLLIAIGGYVIKLNVLGSDLENILYMRTIEDADQIVSAARRSKIAVVIGGGFIGLEFATSFRVNGVEDVTVLVMEDYYWQGKLDRDSSLVLQNTLEKNGVKILTNEEIGSFKPIEGLHPKNAVGAVKTKSGKIFECEVVGVGIGIKSDLSWLGDSGIKIDRAIVTNQYLETSVSDVYAAGDCAEFHDVIFERQHIMGNWANATSQGAAVGKTITGQRTVFETASSYTINFFNGFCSFIGVTDSKFADKIISRGSVKEGKMTRIFVKKISGVTRVVGATVINDPAEVGPLTTMVKSKIDVSAHIEKLSDQSFDLKHVLL